MQAHALCYQALWSAQLKKILDCFTVIRATPRVISMPCILPLGHTLTDFSTISLVAAG